MVILFGRGYTLLFGYFLLLLTYSVTHCYIKTFPDEVAKPTVKATLGTSKVSMQIEFVR